MPSTSPVTLPVGSRQSDREDGVDLGEPDCDYRLGGPREMRSLVGCSLRTATRRGASAVPTSRLDFQFQITANIPLDAAGAFMSA